MAASKPPSVLGIFYGYPASLVAVEGPGLQIPSFKGEMEVRVQSEVLRIAGRFRKGLGWREDRVKIVLKDVIHARVRGSQVDLWLRVAAAPSAPLQRLSLELFTQEAAGELAQWLPAATPWREPAVAAPGGRAAADHRPLWVAGAGLAVVVLVLVALILVVLLNRRVY